MMTSDITTTIDDNDNKGYNDNNAAVNDAMCNRNYLHYHSSTPPHNQMIMNQNNSQLNILAKLTLFILHKVNSRIVWEGVS